MKLRFAYFLILWGFALPAYAQIANIDTNIGVMPQESEQPAIDINNVDANNIENAYTETEVEYVPENVFPPDVIKDMLNCNASTRTDHGRHLKIIGKENERCHIHYANFDLFVPSSLLSNIHSFEDIETLLKNKDIAHYDYKADYLYEGLTYALNACLNKKDFDGRQEELADDYVVINRGLISEFANGICTIELINQQDIEGVITDYGVICKLSYKALQDLEPYFKDLIEKYGEKRHLAANGRMEVERDVYNNETDKADDAFMYYLQQNNFCTKKNDL